MNPTLAKFRKAALTVMTAATLAAMNTVAFAQEPPAQVGAQGIKVHGRWTIDVRNEDGTLAAHYEFDNALQTGGAQVLAGLLGSAYKQINYWQVILVGPNFGGPCDFQGRPGPCNLTQHVGSGAAGLGELTLNLPLNVVGAPSGTIELNGLMRAVHGDSISSVRSALYVCVDASCPGGYRVFNFSLHDLATAIPIAANQVFEVKVVFSFS
jgi:hypothetical protein